MNKKNRLTVLMGTLSLLLVAVIISCTRNLSVPVTAIVVTATQTNTPAAATATFSYTPASSSTFTYTPTVTDTNTPSSTPTNTTTSTATNTLCVGCNTNTATYTATSTYTSTATNTPTNTCTNTVTPTPTNTSAVATATPSTFFDFDDFDCTTDWTGTTSPSYLYNPDFGSGAAGLTSVVASPSFAGGQSFEVNVTGWGAGTGGSAGFALMQFECGDPYDWDSVGGVANTCNDTVGGYNGAPTDLTTGTTNSTGTFTPSYLSAQIYSAGGPVTLAYVSVYDNGGVHAECPLGINIPNGVWTNVVVELTATTGTGAYAADSWEVPYSGGTPINPNTLAWNNFGSAIYTVVGQPGGSAQIYYDSIYFY